MYAVQCRDISAVSVRQIPVGRRDTGNMGAVLALRVRLMRYVQILVDVAIAVCDLFCPVQIRRADAFLDMQQTQLFVDLVRIEQIERGFIGFDGFLCARCVLLKRVFIRTIATKISRSVNLDKAFFNAS